MGKDKLTTPRFLIQADLARFASGITLEATAGSPGIDVELVITDSLGHEWIANAARVGLSSLWSVTSTALPTGTYPAAVAARVVVTDGQTAPQTDTSPLSSSTVLYVDTEAPAATTPALAFYSDTGTVGDGITNQRTPAYTGLAEANSLVRLFVSTTANPSLVVIGQTTAGSDQSDGVPGDGWGRWEITSEPLQDGSYTVWAVVEDLAGNSSLPSSTQTIEVDTQTSNSTFRDLLFDFGSGNSPVAPGYVGVPAEQRYTLVQGYGWTTAVSGFDRGAIRGAPAAESDLLRDGAWSGAAKAKRTFRADLLAGDYQVTVMLGDASYARDKMQVKANGNVVTPPSGVNTAAGQFAVVSSP